MVPRLFKLQPRSRIAPIGYRNLAPEAVCAVSHGHCVLQKGIKAALAFGYPSGQSSSLPRIR